MNATKKINVNFSSLVGLKAELLRKQAEVNETRLKSEPLLSNKKKSKKVVVDDVKKDGKKSMDSEDIVAHKKSKLMLEAKARLYERLRRSKNNSDKFLVDFENKLDESDEELVDETIDKEHPVEPEENWVEYQDCFGRTRKCLREDLPHMQRKDQLIKQEIMKKRKGEDKEEESKEQYCIQEKEPEIEIMRRKWEEQTQKLADKVDIHYQDILFDEARTHGVGYYAFSQDEEERVKQQENLAKLRKDTERKQKEMKETKELKERMEQNRLKAARIRQRIRAGLPAEPTEEELAQGSRLINSTDDINTDKGNESDEKDKEKSNEKTDHISTSISDSCEKKETSDEDKIKAFGELLGKKNHWHVMSQEEWVDKCRAQRISKFGPIYDNFASAGFYNSFRNVDDEESTHKETKELDNTETCDSQKSIEESNSNLQNHEDNNGNEKVFDMKDIDSNSQNDKNNLSAYNAASNSPCESSGDTIGPTLISTMTLSNLSQRQATVSYPLSHLSSNYSQNTYGYSRMYTSEEQKQTDMNIPLPGENNVSPSASSTICTNKQESLSRSINEDNIMAGLKYLRKKFEASHSKST